MNTMHSVPPLAAKSSFPPTWRKVLFASVGKGAWKRPGKGAKNGKGARLNKAG